MYNSSQICKCYLSIYLSVSFKLRILKTKKTNTFYSYFTLVLIPFISVPHTSYDFVFVFKLMTYEQQKLLKVNRKSTLKSCAIVCKVVIESMSNHSFTRLMKQHWSPGTISFKHRKLIYGYSQQAAPQD